MELRIRVTLESDTYDVVTTPWVIMQWERKFKTKVSKVVQDGLGLEDIAWLAWEASKAAGRTVPINFDQFAKTVTAIEMVGDDEATPTQAAASDG
jgi:hypothetical protein